MVPGAARPFPNFREPSGRPRQLHPGVGCTRVFILFAASATACGADSTQADSSPWLPPGSGTTGAEGSTGDAEVDDGQTSAASDGDDPDEGDGSESGPPPMMLPCDDGFGFTPDPLETGSVGAVTFTDPTPLAFVDIDMTGPGDASVTFDDLIASEPYTWRWEVTGLVAGVWEVSFAHGDPAQVVATCQVEVLDTGPAPPPPPPSKACNPGGVCGDAGPDGAVCDVCPMVDTCLEPPSPYGPDGPGEWSCLDNAGCQEDSGQCRIWCPGEPCDKSLHPEGCPQGVETCFVDASITNYEEACQACCESRFHEPTGEFACWDAGLNLCRYPGDCGTPLPG